MTMDHRGEKHSLLTVTDDFYTFAQSLWEYAHASPNEEGDANSEDPIGDHRGDSYGSASSTAGIEEGSDLNSSIPDEQEPLMNDKEFTFINYTPNDFAESTANPADADVDSMDELASYNGPENHQAPTLSELLQDNPGHFRGIFQSREHFEALNNEYLTRQNGHGKASVDLAQYPNCLDDLPTSREARNTWRERLFNAIKDMSMVQNEDRRPPGTTGQPQSSQVQPQPRIENTHVRRVKAFKDFHVEFIAYKLLELAEEIHQGNVNIGDWTESRQWTFQQFPSFEHRMHWLIRALRVNKSLACGFADPDFATRWVCAPRKETEKFEENLRTAARRRQQIARGMQLEDASSSNAGAAS